MNLSAFLYVLLFLILLGLFVLSKIRAGKEGNEPREDSGQSEGPGGGPSRCVRNEEDRDEV